MQSEVGSVVGMPIGNGKKKSGKNQPKYACNDLVYMYVHVLTLYYIYMYMYMYMYISHTQQDAQVAQRVHNIHVYALTFIYSH